MIMAWSTPKKTIALVAVVLVAIFVLPRWLFKPAVLSVTGVGRVSIKPEKASLMVTRSDLSSVPAVAIQKGNEAIDQMITDAKMIVGEDAEVLKSVYSVTQVSIPQVNSDGQVASSKGYQVVNGFQITFSKVEAVSDLIQKMYEDGAAAVSNINFISQNEDDVNRQAVKLAVEDARKEGKKMTRAMRKILGKMVSVSIDQGKAASTVSAEKGVVGSQEMEVVKTASVVYEVW